MAAKLTKIEIRGLFHWKAECLLMKMGSFGVSSNLHYGHEVSLFEAKRDFSNNLFGYFGSNFQATYGKSKIRPYGQLWVEMGHTIKVSPKKARLWHPRPLSRDFLHPNE